MIDFPTRWMHVLYALPVGIGIEQVSKAPSEPLGFVGCSLIVLGGVLMVGNEASVVLAEIDRLRRYAAADRPEEVKRAPEPGPDFKTVLPEGLRPFIRVDGKPRASFNYVANAVKLNKEREMYTILWSWHERGREINLTEAYWLKQRKQFKRREFVNVKERGEANGIFYRLSAAKNAAHDVNDWQKVEKIARGGPLPH